MAKYKVYAKYVEYGYVIVDAESEEDAYEKAEETRSEDFIVDDGGYWETGECEVIK